MVFLFSYVVTDEKLPYIKTTNNSGEQLGQEKHVVVACPSKGGFQIKQALRRGLRSCSVYRA